MARRRRTSPLPPRDGVDATRVVLRDGAGSVASAILAVPSCAGLTLDDLRRRVAMGEVLGAAGDVVDLDAPAVVNTTVYLYRDLPVEAQVPFDLPVLYRDDDIVVVDKPHFLATMPRGSHVVESALVRLRRTLGIDAVSPAHRLDRLTAGVLVFTLRPGVRADYQRLFADRMVEKEYRALAPVRPELTAAVEVADRIVKTAGDLRARVVDGPVNARSTIELLDARTGEYRLWPHTGRTHQLRMHMAALGVGIVDDPLYPQVRPELAALPDAGDFSRPLRLVAHRLAFVDPISGAEREFFSHRRVVGPAPDSR
ncbi:pseudouridine synthase [Williamsia sterculiae]|uniref:RNA pseudouridylate synthase n=1 Tax=Williamsia sterculiae TaxID=1344003 RepID=A0A1N7F6M4_9NOCA|nr:pseudouridine synthase [Williamsia sterculiae]SIR95949.1 tRNA pseudouridine32 synthase / 23S rRNA pseudouridine746 synthase [Williamsia sterculiae]